MPPFRRRTTMRCALASLLVGVSGCNDPVGAIACTSEARQAINVFVRDAVSDAPIASGATLVLRDGTFADSVTSPFGDPSNNQASLSPLNSFERAGTYAVTVRRANYVQWDTTGVRVTEGVCHVNTVTLTARLSPLP
jgi:hypothetical protein